MPEPNYNEGDPPTFLIWVIVLAVLFFGFVLVQACI
jgi:hypothetical protein